MIAAVLAVCLLGPAFVELGPAPCDASPCRCSDVDWDESPGATSYDVERETISTGYRIAAGSVVDGLRWSTFRDLSAPHEGTPYRYRVRACDGSLCSTWSAWVENQGFPFACFDVGGAEIACYVGAPLRVPR
jgi:hypothetical protein